MVVRSRAGGDNLWHISLKAERLPQYRISSFAGLLLIARRLKARHWQS